MSAKCLSLWHPSSNSSSKGEKKKAKKCRHFFYGPGLYLSWGLDTFPQAEVKDEDHHDQAQGQLPSRQAQVLDTLTLMKMQHTSSAKGHTGKQ